jgi:hypothetical protein
MSTIFTEIFSSKQWLDWRNRCSGFGYIRPGVVVHACNPNTQETETGRLRIQGKPGLSISSPRPKNHCIIYRVFCRSEVLGLLHILFEGGLAWKPSLQVS